MKNFPTKNYKKKFEEDGYVIIRSFFDAEKVSEIYQGLRANEVSVLGQINNLMEVNDYDWSKNWGLELDSIKYLKHANAWFQDLSYFLDLSLFELVAKITRQHFIVTQIELHQKFPGVSNTPPHQDNFYFYLNTKKNFACTAYIALNKQNANQGGLGFYTGSHLRNFEHYPSDTIGFSSGICDDMSDYEFITPNFEPGDVVIQHCNVVHAAPQNSSADIRSNVAIRLFPQDTEYDETLKEKYLSFLNKSKRIDNKG